MTLAYLASDLNVKCVRESGGDVRVKCGREGGRFTDRLN